MTEFEINKKVARKLGIDDDYGTFTPLLKYSFDPCNNPEQAWEIMLRYNISIRFEEGLKPAAFTFDKCATHKKPLVAAMLVFLEI